MDSCSSTDALKLKFELFGQSREGTLIERISAVEMKVAFEDEDMKWIGRVVRVLDVVLDVLEDLFHIRVSDVDQLEGIADVANVVPDVMVDAYDRFKTNS